MVRVIDARNAAEARAKAPKAAILRQAHQPGIWFAFDTANDAMGHPTANRQSA